MNARTNKSWLRDLRSTGNAYNQALLELRDFLMRAVLVYLTRHRSDLSMWTAEDLRHFAEDMVQEAIIDIEDNLDSFRGDAKFTTWAYRFVINRAIGELRRSRYRDISYEEIQEVETAFFERLQAESSGVSPETKAEQQEMAVLLLNIIQNELTIRQRQAMVMAYFQGQSMEKVAENLNISRNALYKLLFDARQKMKAALSSRHLSEGDILAPFEE